MRYLVTGGSGFLGFEIIKELRDQGHDVVNFSRRITPELKELGIETIQGDLTNPKDVLKATKDRDAIFHVAGKVAMWGDWKDFYDINVGGAKNLINACKENNVKKIVFTSSPSVAYGDEAIENGDESLEYPKEYLSLYAKSKGMAEKLILEANSKDLLTCAIRPHLIFGKRDQNIIPRLVEARSKNKLKRIGDGTNIVDVIHVKNAVNAHLKAEQNLTAGSPVCGQAYFIGQERPVNLWSFIDSILKAKKQRPVDKSISLKKAYTVGHIIEFIFKLFRIKNTMPPMTRFVAMQMGTSHYFSHKKAKDHFGYEISVTIEEALEELKA